MKLLLALALFFSATAFPIQITFSGEAPSTTSFSASNSQSRTMACEGNTVEVMNNTTAILAIGISEAGTVPSSDYKYVPAGPAAGTRFKPKGGLSYGLYLYIRTPGGAITSGTVEISCTTEE